MNNFLRENNLKNKNTTTLTKLANPDLLPKEYVYKRVGNLELKLEVFEPCTLLSGGASPAIVCIHGGGWHVGRKEWFRVHARYFAQRGMVAFSINYRLVNVLQGIKDSENPVMLVDAIEDCKSAIRFIRANAVKFGVDPSKVGIMGDSAGAHMAAIIAGADFFDNTNEDLSISSKPDFAILCNGIYSLLRDDIWNQKMSDTPLSATEIKARIGLGLGNEISNSDVRNYILSPISFCETFKGDCLLLHGTADTVVPIEQSYEFSNRLKKSGVNCKCLSIIGAQHAFVLPWYHTEEKIIVDAMRKIDDFLVENSYLKKGANLLVSPMDEQREQPPFEYR